MLMTPAFVLGAFSAALAQSQEPTEVIEVAPKDWVHLSYNDSNIYGVGTFKANEYLKNKKPQKKVVVAVIDSGVDKDHPALAPVMWVNEKEVAGNGVDDDKNGYIDDINGWNFIGGKDGKNVNEDSYELTREYLRLSEKYADANKDELAKDKNYQRYLEIKKEFQSERQDSEQGLVQYEALDEMFTKAARLMNAYFDTESIIYDSLNNLESPDIKIQEANGFLLFAHENGLTQEMLGEAINYFENKLNYGLNIEFDPRPIVGDDFSDKTEKDYGNSDVIGPDSEHGTHVAGIIAAQAGVESGLQGVANNVAIMSIRTVPDGDERDKDVANAIRYAVDNGADIINMSFGKSISPSKKVVDDAVKYAMSKGVLLLHAAGNDAVNIDEETHYPSRTYLNSRKKANNWIEVGASSWKSGENLVANFSNYGKKTVDVFAPGVDIYSTVPNGGYEKLSGTSMATPVTSGVAALIKSYFPDLSAKQIKSIIIKSATKLKSKEVNFPSEMGEEVKGKFGELSSTGSIVNAYEAVKMADKMSKY